MGGAAAGIVVWQGVNLGVDLYLANALPQGVPVPTDRRALALLLWETAGKPEVALPTLYGDIPAEEIELQKATHWAVQNGLMDAADKKDASFFDPDHYVTKMDVFGAWLRLKKLLGTESEHPRRSDVPLNAKDLPACMGWGALCFKTEKFRCFWGKTWYTKGN